MTLTQPLKWHGGKHYLAEWIIRHFPPHVHYVEPFFGGGSVLLAKSPHKVSEVVNDVNKDLMIFWKVLQGLNSFSQLKRLCEATPFSEAEFKDAQLDLLEGHPDTDHRVIRAWRFFIVARQSRQGLLKDFATLSRNRTRRDMNEQVSSWLTSIDGLADVHRRLQRVVVLCDDATAVIRQQDGPNTLFYCDPPYLHSTRVTTKDYRYEMTETQHKELLRVLSQITGKFVLSGYRSQLYDTAASTYGWFRDEKEIDNKASSSETKELKTECLWTNFDWRAEARGLGR